MADFETETELNVVVNDSSLATARREIESDLGDIAVDVEATPSDMVGDGGASGGAITDGGNASEILSVTQATNSRLDSVIDLADDRNAILRDTVDELIATDGVDGAGLLGGEGGLLNSLGLVGAGGALGSLGKLTASSLVVGGSVVASGLAVNELIEIAQGDKGVEPAFEAGEDFAENNPELAQTTLDTLNDLFSLSSSSDPAGGGGGEPTRSGATPGADATLPAQRIANTALDFMDDGFQELFTFDTAPSIDERTASGSTPGLDATTPALQVADFASDFLFPDQRPVDPAEETAAARDAQSPTGLDRGPIRTPADSVSLSPAAVDNTSPPDSGDVNVNVRNDVTVDGDTREEIRREVTRELENLRDDILREVERLFSGGR